MFHSSSGRGVKLKSCQLENHLGWFDTEKYIMKKKNRIPFVFLRLIDTEKIRD